LCWIGEPLLYIHSSAAIKLEERNAAAAAKVGHLDELDASEALSRRALYLVSVKRFEVV
jgi:hypothetical protein